MSEPGNSEGEFARPPTLHRVFLGRDDRLRPIFRALLFFTFALALTVPLQLAVLKLGRGVPQGALLAALFALLNPVWLLLSWFFLRVFDQRSFRTLGLWFYPGWGRQLAGGLGIGAGLMSVIVAGLVATRGVAYQSPGSAGTYVLLGILGNGSLMVLAAVFEEIAFHGYGFQRLVDAVGPLGAVAILSGLFGAAHLMNPSVTALSTANTVLAGVLLSVAYLKTRALWLPIGLHWAWNFTMGPIFSLPVSGLRFGPPLLRAKIIGPKWLTGGAYGPEGGVVLTIVCLGAILWLARTRRVSPSPAMEEVLK